MDLQLVNVLFWLLIGYVNCDEGMQCEQTLSRVYDTESQCFEAAEQLSLLHKKGHIKNGMALCAAVAGPTPRESGT